MTKEDVMLYICAAHEIGKRNGMIQGVTDMMKKMETTEDKGELLRWSMEYVTKARDEGVKLSKDAQATLP